jgi:serine/threonine-protein kinase
MSLPAEVEAAMADPRRRVGQYVLVDRVGKGGVGEVYKAWDTKLSRWIAMKFLLKASSDEDRRRFQREAQAVARLAHPHIVAIHEIGEHQGRPFIAMQFVDGRSLDDAKLAVKKAAQAVREASLGVHAAHEAGLVHRDLKPSNLMMDKSGRTFVTDFGLARSEEDASKISQAGMILGTPSYMSPEQAEGRRLTPRSDVYSLGATLYTLVTGRIPFLADTPAQTVMQVINKEPDPPRAVRPDLPAEVETIIIKAMEKDPARRYRSAAALAEDLRRWLEGEPITAAPPTLVHRLKRSVGRRGAVVGAVAAGMIIAGTVVAALVSRAASARAFDDARREARAAFEEGRWDAAKSAAKRALDVRRDRALEALVADCDARLAEAAAEKEKLERFRALRERIAPLEAVVRETRPMFYSRAIDIREKLDRVEQAMRSLEAILKEPAAAAFPDGWVLLGMGRYFLGDGPAAEQALAKAESLGARDGAVAYFLARILLERSMAARLTVGAATNEARLARAKALADRAAGYLERATRSGWVEEVDLAVAEAYRAFAQDRRDETRRLCLDGLRRHPTAMGAEEFWNVLGFVASGREQVECYSRALDHRPHWPWALFMRGIERGDIGDVKGGADDLTAAIRILPRWALPWLNRAEFRRALGDDAGALADLDEAIRLDPSIPDAWYNRGNVRKALDRVEEAIADYTKALELDPKMAEAAVNRGNAKLRLKDVRGALDDYEIAIAARPNWPEAYASRASAKEANGELRGAVADLRKALDLAPPNWHHRPAAEQHIEILRRKIGD